MLQVELHESTHQTVGKGGLSVIDVGNNRHVSEKRKRQQNPRRCAAICDSPDVGGLVHETTDLVNGEAGREGSSVCSSRPDLDVKTSNGDDCFVS
jgi:hypothetical protein